MVLFRSKDIAIINVFTKGNEVNDKVLKVNDVICLEKEIATYSIFSFSWH